MAVLSGTSDLVLALRLIRKQPILTLTAIVSLATGIGLATTGFTFLEAVVRAELPFSGGHRFVMVDVYEEPAATRGRISLERFEILRSAGALQHLGAMENAAQNLVLPSEEVVLVSGVAITPSSFAVLPFAPVLGRTLLAADALPGAAPVILIRESLWRRHFSSDPAAIGRRANFSGVQREIVGVMPDALEFPNSPEIWMPLYDVAAARVFGVLAAAGNLSLAQQQLTAISQQFERARPDAPRLRLRVLPFIEALSQGVDMLAAAVVFVLVLILVVIAANVANLVLARTLARSSELAVRSALGATRRRLVAQVFTEVLVLGVLSAAIGVFASRQALGWIQSLVTDMPFWVNLDAGPRTATFVAVITIAAAAIGGAWPAFRATRRDAVQVLAAANRRVAAGLGVAGSAMIALQIALSIAALYAALVVARGVTGYRQGAGTPRESQIITARLYFPVLPDQTPTERSRDERAAAVLGAVGRLPIIEHAGLGTSLPRLSPATSMTSIRRDSRDVPSTPRPAPVVAISPGFIETLGARVTAGRVFNASDQRAGAPPVAIVNEPFVAKFFAGTASPVGHQVYILDPEAIDGAPVWREIVGVVPDLGLSAGDQEFAGGVYVPLRDESLAYLAVIARGEPAAVERTLTRAIAATDPTIQVREVLPLANVGYEDRAVFAGIGATLTALGVIALALSVIGVYAMLSYAVTARTREIAIRSALGASRAQLLQTVLGRAAVPLVIGAIVGPALGVALVAVRGIFAFRLPAEAGPWAIPSIVVVMATAAGAAAFMPARRALGVRTTDALRAE